MRVRAALTCTLVLVSCACAGTDEEPEASNAAPIQTNGADTASDRTGEDDRGVSGEPVQLTMDPCTLVTKAEAEALIGPVNDADGGIYDPPKCIYVSSESSGGQLVISLTEPDFCKLLFLALEQDQFGGAQVRVDDLGDGGMLVEDTGNAQFAVGGGCVEVDGNVDHDTNIDDDAILRLAQVAAERAG